MSIVNHVVKGGFVFATSVAALLFSPLVCGKISLMGRCRQSRPNIASPSDNRPNK